MRSSGDDQAPPSFGTGMPTTQEETQRRKRGASPEMNRQAPSPAPRLPSLPFDQSSGVRTLDRWTRAGSTPRASPSIDHASGGAFSSSQTRLEAPLLAPLVRSRGVGSEANGFAPAEGLGTDPVSSTAYQKEEHKSSSFRWTHYAHDLFYTESPERSARAWFPSVSTTTAVAGLRLHLAATFAIASPFSKLSIPLRPNSCSSSSFPLDIVS